MPSCRDAGEKRILAVDLLTGTRAVLVENVPGAAYLDEPRHLAYDPGKNCLYLVDTAAAAVFKIDAASGSISVLAGSGAPGSENRLEEPTSLYFDGAGDRLLVVDAGRDAVLEIDLDAKAGTAVTAFDSAGSLVLPPGDRTLV